MNESRVCWMLTISVSSFLIAFSEHPILSYLLSPSCYCVVNSHPFLFSLLVISHSQLPSILLFMSSSLIPDSIIPMPDFSSLFFQSYILHHYHHDTLYVNECIILLIPSFFRLPFLLSCHHLPHCLLGSSNSREGGNTTTH